MMSNISSRDLWYVLKTIVLNGAHQLVYTIKEFPEGFESKAISINSKVR